MLQFLSRKLSHVKSSRTARIWSQLQFNQTNKSIYIRAFATQPRKSIQKEPVLSADPVDIDHPDDNEVPSFDPVGKPKAKRKKKTKQVSKTDGKTDDNTHPNNNDDQQPQTQTITVQKYTEAGSEGVEEVEEIVLPPLKFRPPSIFEQEMIAKYELFKEPQLEITRSTVVEERDIKGEKKLREKMKQQGKEEKVIVEGLLDEEGNSTTMEVDPDDMVFEENELTEEEEAAERAKSEQEDAKEQAEEEPFVRRELMTPIIGDPIPQQLLTFVPTWSFLRGQAGSHNLRPFVKMAKEAGYTGIEMPIKFAMDFGRRNFLALMREFDMYYIATVFSSGPRYLMPGLHGYDQPEPMPMVEQHFQVWRHQVQEAHEFRPIKINSHTGADYYTIEEKVRFMEGAMMVENSLTELPGFLTHETVPGRILNNFQTVRQFVYEYKTRVRVNLNLSALTLPGGGVLAGEQPALVVDEGPDGKHLPLDPHRVNYAQQRVIRPIIPPGMSMEYGFDNDANREYVFEPVKIDPDLPYKGIDPGRSPLLPIDSPEVLKLVEEIAPNVDYVTSRLSWGKEHLPERTLKNSPRVKKYLDSLQKVHEIVWKSNASRHTHAFLNVDHGLPVTTRGGEEIYRGLWESTGNLIDKHKKHHKKLEIMVTPVPL